MTEFRNDLIFTQMKHSNSANKLGQNQGYPVTLKVKKEGAVKLNKILFNLQPSIANKTSYAKAPKSANTSNIQNSSILESKQVREIRVTFKKKTSLDSPPLDPQNSSNNGMIRVVNSYTKLKPRATHTRSLSNGHFRPVEKSSINMNDTTMNRYINATPVRMDDNPLGTKVKGFKIGASYNVPKPEDNLDKTRIDVDNYTRSLKKYTRQKSISLLKQGSLVQELDVSLPKLQKKLTAREDKSTAEDSEIKPVKKEEDSKWRPLIFNTTIEKEVLEAHIKLVTEGLHYAINFLKPPSMSYVESRQVILDKKHREGIKTLVLDLDETLIRSCQPEDEPDMILTPRGVTDQKLHIKVRPFTFQFLNIMKEHFEIVVFTASSELYANTIVNALDPKKECISYLFHRGFCFETNKGIRIKDLRIFKNRDLKDIIIVDNFVPAFSFQLENGVPILEWVGNKKDKELKFLVNYLLKAKDSEDMREFNRKHLNLLELAKTSLPSIVP